MADTDFTLPFSLKMEIEGMDCISQYNNDVISAMAKTIKRLSTDKEIAMLARHIDYLARDTANSVNAAAEILGANYKEPGRHD